MHTNNALRVLDAPYEQLHPTTKPRKNRKEVFSLRLHKATNVTAPASTPEQTLAMTRKSIRQQASMLRTVGKILSIFGVVTEAAIGILCGNAVGSWGIWVSAAFLLLAIVSAFVCIGIAYFLFSSSEILTQEVRKLKKEV